MANELLNLDCKRLRDEIAAGRIKSVAATEAVFELIEKCEPVVGAYISTFKEEALASAGEVDDKVAAGGPQRDGDFFKVPKILDAGSGA